MPSWTASCCRCRSPKTIAEMITGGVFERHPRLKIISVENDIGWLPNYLKRLEWYSWRFGARFPQLKQNAADYWRRQVYATFQDDVPGIRCRDLIGVDKIMWGSDYPHFDSTFPSPARRSPATSLACRRTSRR